MKQECDPLTSIDLDLRDFPYMPLEVVRLRDSDLAVVASGDEFRAAVMLWCAAWHQLPAASLPNDERLLANLAGYGRDLKGWRLVSVVALRGFVLCSDDRLYHPVIADKALEAGTKRRRQRSQTSAATKARLAANAQRNETRNETRNDPCDEGPEPERNVHQEKGREERGVEERTIQGKTLSVVEGARR